MSRGKSLGRVPCSSCLPRLPGGPTMPGRSAGSSPASSLAALSGTLSLEAKEICPRDVSARQRAAAGCCKNSLHPLEGSSY